MVAPGYGGPEPIAVIAYAINVINIFYVLI